MQNFSSIYAPAENMSVSEKYVTIDSGKIVEELVKKGFVLREIKQAKTGRGRHIIRMRANGERISPAGETLYPELIIMNSYDKKCSFSVRFGIYRLVCSNGLTIAVPGTESVYLCRHMGEPAKIAEEIAVQFAEQMETVFAVQNKFEKKQLTENQAINLAMRAAEIRWQKSFTREEAKKLLETARPEDDGLNAWVIFNKLQERLINGGIKIGDMKKTPKAVNVPRENHRINLELFESAYEMVTKGRLTAYKPSVSEVAEMN